MAQIQRRETSDGDVRWTMRVFVGRDPATGKRRFITETFGRKKDAEKEARRLEREKDQGTLVVPSRDSLQDYLAHWLKNVKEGRVRDRTLADYRGYVRRYIEEPPDGAPPIGIIELRRLRAGHFEKLYAYMYRDMELSPRTIKYLHAIVRQALGHAVKVRKLARNPTDGVKPPSRPQEGEDKTTMRAMTEGEARRFMEAAREDRYHALWAVLLMGGLRPGEALALKWKDVNLDEGRLRVRRSLTRRGVEGWKLVEPKTARARRAVALPAVAVRALSEWKAQQGKERLQLGAEYEDRGFVFTTEFGKPLNLGNLRSRNFNRVMARAGLGQWAPKPEKPPRGPKPKRDFDAAFRIYDLRHTCATLLLLAGENAKVVSERLGHASVSLTLDTYSHVLPDMQEGAADRLDELFQAAHG